MKGYRSSCMDMSEDRAKSLETLDATFRPDLRLVALPTGRESLFSASLLPELGCDLLWPSMLPLYLLVYDSQILATI